MSPGTGDAPGPEGWWLDFFVAEHADFQQALAEEHDTDAETRLVLDLGDVRPGTRVLDVPCGHGRHAVRLAGVGARVTAVDASPAMTASAARCALNRGVVVDWRAADMRTLDLDREFDVAICLGGSFGYFGRAADEQFLATLFRALVPDGRLLLDVPSLAFVRAHHAPHHEATIGGASVRQHRHLAAASGVARVDVTVTRRGTTVSRAYHQQLYELDAVERMLDDVGFDVAGTWDAAERPGYATNVGHVLVLARRPARASTKRVAPARYAGSTGTDPAITGEPPEETASCARSE